jgi:ribosomal protein L34E
MSETAENRETPANEMSGDTVYIFEVHGFLPELMPGMAFRIDKHFCTKDKKILKCPYCGGVFTTVDKAVKVELRCFSKESIALGHPAIKCGVCKKKVGVVHAIA